MVILWLHSLGRKIHRTPTFANYNGALSGASRAFFLVWAIVVVMGLKNDAV